MPDRFGFRGYIATRAVRGQVTPQHVQNIVVRDYAARNALDYKLSAVEYAMPGCYLMLETVLDELPRLEGIVCYSVFQLPGDARRRHEVYRRVLDSGASLHGAVEGIALSAAADVDRLEDVFLVDHFSALSPAIPGYG